MVEPINTETRVMEGVRFSQNFVAGWNSCLFAIRSNPLEKISHKEAARMIEDAANSITTKEAAIDLLTRVGIRHKKNSSKRSGLSLTSNTTVSRSLSCPRWNASCILAVITTVKLGL